MKKLLTILLGLMTFNVVSQAASPTEGKKVLIAYFSRVGQNYVSGDIVKLTVGNTAVVAGKIRHLTGGDIFEIRTVKAYPDDYHETTEIAKRELHEHARPELVGEVPDISGYDTIILGYPNWWGTMPMAVFTFIEKCGNLAGKTVLPFCTHEGSGMGNSVRDLKKACPEAQVLTGLAIKGTLVYRKDPSVDSKIVQWLKS